jgi:primosomal replication protein N
MKTIKLPPVHRLALFLFLCVLQAGCGGGGADGLASGGIGGTGITVSSVGTTTGFGSVIVDGLSYDTTAAEVVVENTAMGSGNQALIQNIAVGMVVRVEGRLDAEGNAIADRVFFSNELKGPVDSINELDAVSRQLVILGQTVLMDDRTVYRNTDAASIAVGMVLEVSGFIDEFGSINATYVNKVADSLLPNDSVDVKGLVQNLDPQSKTFQFNSLTVDYSTANINELPGGAPSTGQLLKVRGRPQTASLAVAESLEPAEEFGSGVFDTVDLEGIITQTVSPNEFRIGRYTITVDTETLYENLEPEDLNRGTRVIVRGTLADRSILADEIILSEKIKLESNADTVSLADKSLVLSGLEAVTALTTATTRINGTATSLDQVLPGDHVRMVGRLGPGGELLASSLLVNPSNEAVNITGPVESATSPILVILGVEIDTGSIPADGFFGLDGKRVSPDEFFASVKAGDFVTAAGILQGGLVTWNTVGFK